MITNYEGCKLLLHIVVILFKAHQILKWRMDDFDLSNPFLMPLPQYLFASLLVSCALDQGQYIAADHIILT